MKKVIDNIHVKVDPKQSLDPIYFERRLIIFQKKYRDLGIPEELRYRRYFYKPSLVRRKGKKALR